MVAVILLPAICILTKVVWTVLYK